MTLLSAAAGGLGMLLAAMLLARRRGRAMPRPSRKERLRQAYLDAANDPAFLAEMDEIDRAFDVTVGDGLDEPLAARA